VSSVLDPEGEHLASLRKLADVTDASVLEVGCGDGRLTAGIAAEATRVFAFDPDSEEVVSSPPLTRPQPRSTRWSSPALRGGARRGLRGFSA
jgi:hypothetical protein